VVTCRKILVIEDHDPDRRLVKMALSSPKWILLEASDGEQGLALALEERPDLIIMDVRLPKLDGLQLTRKLRATPGFKHTPIIAITAYAMKGDKERVLKAGYTLYLPKPIHIKTLIQQVNRLLEI
jgi:two-component system cell cycle response regulator DivK